MNRWANTAAVHTECDGIFRSRSIKHNAIMFVNCDHRNGFVTEQNRNRWHNLPVSRLTNETFYHEWKDYFRFRWQLFIRHKIWLVTRRARLDSIIILYRLCHIARARWFISSKIWWQMDFIIGCLSCGYLQCSTSKGSWIWCVREQSSSLKTVKSEINNCVFRWILCIDFVTNLDGFSWWRQLSSSYCISCRVDTRKRTIGSRINCTGRFSGSNLFDCCKW